MAFGTLTEQIYDALRRGILAGEFEPGERLKELELAKRFEASQTPVREALARLAQEGFVQIDRYRGATVSVYSARDFENLYQIRLLLELPAIRIAAEIASPEQITLLKDLVLRGESALLSKDRTKFEQVDLDLHESLTACSNNPYLTRITRSNHEKLQTIRKVITANTHIGEHSHMEHIGIVAAIETRDSDRAEALLKHHINRTMDEVLRVFPN